MTRKEQIKNAYRLTGMYEEVYVSSVEGMGCFCCRKSNMEEPNISAKGKRNGA